MLIVEETPHMIQATHDSQANKYFLLKEGVFHSFKILIGEHFGDNTVQKYISKTYTICVRYMKNEISHTCYNVYIYLKNFCPIVK